MNYISALGLLRIQLVENMHENTKNSKYRFQKKKKLSKHFSCNKAESAAYSTSQVLAMLASQSTGLHMQHSYTHIHEHVAAQYRETEHKRDMQRKVKHVMFACKYVCIYVCMYA